MIGRMMKTLRPASCQRPPHASVARSFASSFSARIPSLSTPSKTGKAAMAPTLPSAHVGLRPIWRAVIAVSTPSPMIRRSVTAFVGVQLNRCAAGDAEHAAVDLLSV